jgi:hypothetical protein
MAAKFQLQVPPHGIEALRWLELAVIVPNTDLHQSRQDPMSHQLRAMKTFCNCLVIGCGVLLPMAADDVPKPESSQRALELRNAIEGADRVVVKRIEMVALPDAEPEPTTTLAGVGKIAELAKSNLLLDRRRIAGFRLLPHLRLYHAVRVGDRSH